MLILDTVKKMFGGTSIRPAASKILKGWPWLLAAVAAIGSIYWCFTIGQDYLIPVIGAIIASMAVFRSKPNKMPVAVLSVVLIMLAGGWQAYKDYLASRTKAEFRRRSAQSLLPEVTSFLEHLSALVVRASDGWVPRNDEDLLSPRVARMISSELDVMRDAPIHPQVSLAG